MTVESVRALAARVIANATFAARQAWLWGEGSTAVASDSTHFKACGPEHLHGMARLATTAAA